MPEIDEIMDIFGIPKKSNDPGSETEEATDNDEVYDTLGKQGDTVPFEEKVKDVKEVIQKAVAELGIPSSVKKEDKSVSNEETIKVSVEEVKSKSCEEDILDISNEIIKEDIKKEEDKRIDVMLNKPAIPFMVSETKEELPAGVENKKETYVIVNLQDWNLESPSPKYDKFYAEKKNILKTILKGGKLPFDDYEKDLIDCKVDVSIPIFDTAEIHRKMQEVQGWRDRIKEIQMNCSKQYFKWETALQLLEGLLSKVEYTKPSAGRDGIIYEHLADMKFYFDDLKNIHRSAEIVSKHMDNAFDCLSRQATIAMPNRNIERSNTTWGNVNKDEAFSEKKDILTKEIFPIAKKEEVNIPEKLKDFDILGELGDGAIKPVVKEKKIDLDNGAKQISWESLMK